MLAVALALVGAGTAGAQSMDRTVSAAGARVLQLKVERGDVHLVPRQGQTDVVIRANGRAPELEHFRVGDRVVVNLTGNWGSTVPFVKSVSVSYDISYPASMRLELREFAGAVTIDAPRAPIAVDNSGGAIRVRGAHAAIDLSSDEGDIFADLARDWRGDSIRMETAAGAVHLAVPRRFAAHLDASSGQGQVHAQTRIARAPKPFVWLYSRSGDVFIERLQE